MFFIVFFLLVSSPIWGLLLHPQPLLSISFLLCFIQAFIHGPLVSFPDCPSEESEREIRNLEAWKYSATQKLWQILPPTGIIRIPRLRSSPTQSLERTISFTTKSGKLGIFKLHGWGRSQFHQITAFNLAYGIIIYVCIFMCMQINH